MSYLLLQLRNGDLKSRFLQGLRLLVIVDLLLRNQLIQCLFRVLGDDSVNFSGRILNWVSKRK